MEFGLAQGLSQDLGYTQQVNDIRYQQQMLAHQEAQNEAKRKLFESDMEFQQGGNAFDQPLVKAENQRIVQQIGDFISQNPDWETNFEKRGQVKQMKNSLKDNPTVLRALATNDNRQALLKYAQEAKQKGIQFDEDALNNELQRYSNYEKFGNPDGPDALKQEGMKAYLFNRPQDFVDMNPVYKEAGASMKNPEIVETGMGGYYTKPKNEDVEARVDSILQNHGNQLVKQFSKQGISNPNEIRKLVKQNVIASFDSDFKLGDPLGYARLGMEKKRLDLDYQKLASKTASGGTPVWKYFTSDKNPYGKISEKTIIETWGNRFPITVTGSDGLKVDLSGQDFIPTGEYINTRGNTFLPGEIILPIEEAQAKGIYENNTIFKDKIAAPFRSIASETEVEGKKGEMVKAIKIKTQVPINRNDPMAEQKFKSAVEPSKFVSESDSWDAGEAQPQVINMGGYSIPVGSKVRNSKTGQSGILQADGSIK